MKFNTFQISDTETIITGAHWDTIEEKKSGIVIIPQKIDELMVKNITSSSFEDIKQDIKQVFINADIEIIKHRLFAHAEKLNEIILPKTLNKIEAYAFRCCYSLSSIEIPENVTVICHQVFESSGLETITLPDSIIEIGDGAFKHCEQLYEVNFSKNVRYISSELFLGCRSLSHFKFNNNIIFIGPYSFTGTNLIEADLSETSMVYGNTNEIDNAFDKKTQIKYPYFY